MEDSINFAPLVGDLVARGVLKELIGKYRLSNNPNVDKDLKDEFEQDLAIILLEYPDQERLVRMYARGEINNFIVRIIKNNIFSEKSRYYYKYKKYMLNKVELKNVSNSDDELPDYTDDIEEYIEEYED